LLIATRLDVGGMTVSQAKIDRLLADNKFAIFADQRQMRRQLLGQRERQRALEAQTAHRPAHPWEKLPWTSTPRLLAEIKNAVMAMRDEADIRLLRFAELARRLEQALPNTKIREADVRTAVTLLANHGLLRPLKFGDLVLLRPDLLNGYASGHPRGPRASGRNRLRRGRIDLP
jgi:hypothetical protein